MKVVEYWQETIKNYRYNGDVSRRSQTRDVRDDVASSMPVTMPMPAWSNSPLLLDLAESEDGEVIHLRRIYNFLLFHANIIQL